MPSARMRLRRGSATSVCDMADASMMHRRRTLKPNRNSCCSACVTPLPDDAVVGMLQLAEQFETVFFEYGGRRAFLRQRLRGDDNSRLRLPGKRDQFLHHPRADA